MLRGFLLTTHAALTLLSCGEGGMSRWLYESARAMDPSLFDSEMLRVLRNCGHRSDWAGRRRSEGSEEDCAKTWRNTKVAIERLLWIQ